MQYLDVCTVDVELEGLISNKLSNCTLCKTILYSQNFFLKVFVYRLIIISVFVFAIIKKNSLQLQIPSCPREDNYIDFTIKTLQV